MKVVLTLLVRDEADIVPSFMDYHLQNGVDQILVTDNGSRDGTRDLLQAYERSGQAVVFDEPPSDFSQGVWVTRMARKANNIYGADWVIHGDADEFFVPKASSAGLTIHEALARVPPDIDHLEIQRHDFVPIQRPGLHPPPVDMIYRKKISRNLSGGPLPPKVIHRGVPDATVTQGNHNVTSKFLNSVPHDFSDLEIYHYPIRSLNQFTNKVRNGGSGYTRNKKLSESDGFHKRHWFRLLEEGKLEQEYHRHFLEHKALRTAMRTGDIIMDRSLADRLATG